MNKQNSTPEPSSTSNSNQQTVLEQTIIRLTTNYYKLACCDITNLTAFPSNSAFASGFMDCYLQIQTLTELATIQNSGISKKGAQALAQINHDTTLLFTKNEQAIMKALKQT